MTSLISRTVIEEIHKRRLPIVSSYELFKLLWDVFQRPEKYPYKIRKKTSIPQRLQFNKLTAELLAERFIRPDPDFQSHTGRTRLPYVFRVNENPDAPAEDIFCLVDPFGAVAYLSALQRYGLTTRQPKALSLMTLDAGAWWKGRKVKEHEDYGFDPDARHLNYFIHLEQAPYPEKLRDREITVHRSKISYKQKSVNDSYARILEIGSLFVQTLDAPALCGGIEHVLEIWDYHAEIYLQEIIAAVNDYASSIVKVRAGYILTERMGL